MSIIYHLQWVMPELSTLTSVINCGLTNPGLSLVAVDTFGSFNAKKLKKQYYVVFFYF